MGNLRARLFKVTRERVRNMLQLIDPLGRISHYFLQLLGGSHILFQGLILCDILVNTVFVQSFYVIK